MSQNKGDIMTTTMMEQPFNIDESIERIRQFERSGTEFKVRCLELWRAKLDLKHGAWYPFLAKSIIYPSTATRRMKIASLFLGWVQTARMTEAMAIASAAGIPISIPLPKGYKPTREEIFEGINLIYQEPGKLHDFNEAQKIDIDKFWDQIPQQDNKYSPPRERIFIGQFSPTWKKIEEFIHHKYKRLSKTEKQEFREWLQMQAQRADALVQLVQDKDNSTPANVPPTEEAIASIPVETK
jgi:hypothetical protein